MEETSPSQEVMLWRPLSMVQLLGRYGLGNSRLNQLLMLWLFATIVTIGLAILRDLAGLGRIPLEIGPLHLYYTIFPSLAVTTLLLFGLGYEWALPPALLASLILALHNGMPLQWALLVSFADPMGLAIFALAYRSVPVSYDLRSVKSVIWFVAVSFVSALAISTGAYIRSQAHDNPASKALTSWESWWVGAFLQSVLVIGPLLFVFARDIERWKARSFSAPPRPEPSLRGIGGIITVAGTLLVGFILATGRLADVQVSEALATDVSSATHNAILAAAFTWKMTAWIGAALVIAAALGGILLTRSWSKSLRTQVQTRTSELLESEQRFRATFEQAAVGIAHISADGYLLRINQKLLDMVGYTQEELIGRRFIEITHPDDVSREMEYITRQFLGEMHTWSLEKRFLRKDGSHVWVEYTVSLARDASGGPKYFIAIVIEVTERMRLEEQLRQAQKMEAVGRLAGGVAHDFNNILTAIIGYSEFALSNLSPSTGLWEEVNEIHKAGQRAAALTSQLLAFSRKQVLRPKRLDLNAVVSNLDAMLRRLIRLDIEMNVSLDPELGLVFADPNQVDQVIMNLVVNARDAMPKGGRITIATANRNLDDAFARAHEGKPGPHAMVSVTDTGTGMDAETLRHLFEPFFTTKEQGKGTGLGLSTVYGIVKQSGGTIAISSEPGKGSAFEFYLPLVAGVGATVRTTPTEAPTRGYETVLLVEDDDAVRKLVRGILEGSGYTVIEAFHGEEALRVSQTHAGKIDLMVTDIVMPKMSGWELADRMTILRPDMRTLYVSGYSEGFFKRQVTLKPGAGFLQKPFTPGSLATKVRDVLNGVSKAVMAD